MRVVDQAAQGSCGCSAIGRVQGQAGQGFEEPGLVKDVPAPGKKVELNDL